MSMDLLFSNNGRDGSAGIFMSLFESANKAIGVDGRLEEVLKLLSVILLVGPFTFIRFLYSRSETCKYS